TALMRAGTLESLGAAQVLDVELELLRWAARPLKNRSRLLAHIGTAQVQAVAALIDRAQLARGERGLGQLRLSEPAAAIAGLRFLLRGTVAQARGHASTLGGGRILSVAPRKRRRREADASALQSLAGDDPVKQAEQ